MWPLILTVSSRNLHFDCSNCTVNYWTTSLQFQALREKGRADSSKNHFLSPTAFKITSCLNLTIFLPTPFIYNTFKYHVSWKQLTELNQTLTFCGKIPSLFQSSVSKSIMWQCQFIWPVYLFLTLSLMIV